MPRVQQEAGEGLRLVPQQHRTHLLKNNKDAGETAEQLDSAILAEEPGSVPSTHAAAHTCL